MVAAAISGCGGTAGYEPPGEYEAERNEDLVACLMRHGGERVGSAAELSDVPMPRALRSSGARLDSVFFQAIQFGVPGHRAQVRSIVVLDDELDHWPEAAFVWRVRTDPGRYGAVILMPASRDEADRILWGCQDRVAPGESVP